MLAFTSELIPRLVWIYYKSPDGNLDGFTDWSMSRFKVADFLNDSRPENPMKNGLKPQEFCRFKQIFLKANFYAGFLITKYRRFFSQVILLPNFNDCEMFK